MLGRIPGQGMCSQEDPGVGLVVKYISLVLGPPEFKEEGAKMHKFINSQEVPEVTLGHSDVGLTMALQCEN